MVDPNLQIRVGGLVIQTLRKGGAQSQKKKKHFSPSGHSLQVLLKISLKMYVGCIIVTATLSLIIIMEVQEKDSTKGDGRLLF